MTSSREEGAQSSEVASTDSVGGWEAFRATDVALDSSGQAMLVPQAVYGRGQTRRAGDAV